MSDAFFLSWQLWEQMTFVLACAIVFVFCLGWTKLWWASRRERKQAMVDEEKKVKIQALRTSGVIIKLDRETRIPFGVRALQSGVEIDGIWVSTSNTRIPESPKQLRDSENSSDSSVESNDDDGRPFSSGELTPPRISLSGTLQPAFRPTRIPVENRKAMEEFQASTPNTLSKDLASAYKPRRSSRLRYSSSGDNQIHQDTLCQLEGTSPKLPEKAHDEHRGGIQANVADSSSDATADNELSSGSDSDSTLSGGRAISSSMQPVKAPSSRATSKKSPHRTMGHGYHNSEDSTTSIRLPSRGDYHSVPPDSPPQPKMNPFGTPETSPALEFIETCSKNQSQTDEIEALGETRWPLLSTSPIESPTEPVFMPGSLHANKVARKINSGFELLPAGTFDMAAVAVRNGADGAVGVEASAKSDERKRPKKLQKRGRDSITGKRTSAAFGIS